MVNGDVALRRLFLDHVEDGYLHAAVRGLPFDALGIKDLDVVDIRLVVLGFVQRQDFLRQELLHVLGNLLDD